MDREKTSGYVAHLPAIFQSSAFAGQFLRAFERILSRTIPDTPADAPFVPVRATRASGPNDLGKEVAIPVALEEMIAGLHTYFDPDRTPPDFLPWLARWVGLSLWEDWDVDERRRFIREIVPLYRWRGTKFGMKEVLRIYAGVEEDAVRIHEFDEPVHYFEVMITGRDMDKRRDILIRIIDQEKPAHTYYTLITY